MALTLKFATKAQLLFRFGDIFDISSGIERCRLSALMDSWVKDGYVTDKDIETALNVKSAEVTTAKETLAAYSKLYGDVVAVEAKSIASGAGGKP